VSGLLLGEGFARAYDDRIAAIEADCGVTYERILLPDAPDARLDEDTLGRVELANFSADVFPERSRAFFAATHNAPALRWLHLFNAGTDHPIFQAFFDRGVAVTNSSGASAVPIAQTAIAGMFALARNLLPFATAQRERSWLEASAVPAPPDLQTQTLVVLGLGAIGAEIARLGSAIGMHTIGVRRSPRRAEDPVDELVPPSELARVLPRADWLAIACPLTEQTRRIIDVKALDLMPEGAHILNVARGEIVEESALVAALESGHLAGAYLDVFEVEPLPDTSPLWSHPRVIVTPHASAHSAGNEARRAEIFLDNLRRWSRGERLANLVS
jgi:phosphoglycerate dehydrogenase-like enzyme